MSPHSLPPSESPALPVAALSRAFTNVSSSHKFLWMLSILDTLSSAMFRGQNEPTIPMRHLVYRMLKVAEATLEKFQLEEATPNDRFHEYLESCRERSGLFQSGDDPIEGQPDIVERIPNPIYTRLTGGDRAPYRFLVPFLPRGTHPSQTIIRQVVAAMAATKSPAPYHFSPDARSIIVHPDWARYFAKNMEILRGWVRWHWVQFLETKYPNTPSLAAKIAGNPRQTLVPQRKLWDAAILRFPQKMRCIYSELALPLDDYSIDHYLPWEFVGHNNFWNLIPTLKTVNSSKGMILPASMYLERLADAHVLVIMTYHDNPALRRAHRGQMVSYLSDLQISAHDTLPNREAILDGYHRFVPTLAAVAEGQGFASGWRYERTSAKPTPAG